MSANYELMQRNMKLSSECNRLLQLYENPTQQLGPGFSITLNAAQIQTLKQTFAAKRTEAIAAFNAITAQ